MTEHDIATTAGLVIAGGLVFGAGIAVFAGWDLPEIAFVALVGAAAGVVAGMLTLGDGGGPTP